NTATLKVKDAKGNNITDQLTATWDLKNGKWLLTPKDKAKFLDTYKGQKLTVSFNSVVKADALGTLTNTMNQVNNSKGYKSNTVKNNVEPDPKPTKVVVNTDNTNIDKTSVSHGQVINYTGTWDLSELANHLFTTQELANVWSFSDDYDQAKVAVDLAGKDAWSVKDAKGNSIKDDVKLAWNADDGSWTIT
ncbi:adhesin isopeptide-forming adherence domain-containing protein, partial [Ligilactobacillus equi]|uniref:adhesin isopeptide-forming adherence domain-containing protein n=1 Tax=Ligilactobacillus equi TaxID=137357 RepID=UPI00054DB545